MNEPSVRLEMITDQLEATIFETLNGKTLSVLTCDEVEAAVTGQLKKLLPERLSDSTP